MEPRVSAPLDYATAQGMKESRPVDVRVTVRESVTRIRRCSESNYAMQLLLVQWEQSGALCFVPAADEHACWQRNAIDPRMRCSPQIVSDFASTR